MSWIKDNKFMAVLGGSTLIGVILLYFVGSQGAKRYTEAKEKFDAAATEAAGFERLALYPKPENRDQKRKAIDEYRKSVDSIQNAFAPFRPEELKNISSQEFTNNLLAANAETRKAFEDAGTLVPEPYFVGFENYKTSLAPDKITGVLGYQLTAVKKLMLDLAKSAPSELRNIHRPNLPEENGQAYTPSDTAVARSFPLEITFVGPEKSAREFLSAITKPEGQYAVIRSLRITNEKKDPPRAADAKFEKPAAAPAAAGGADAFSGGFVLPGDEAAAPAPEQPAATTAPKAADSSRILAPVLGDEKVQVFVRLDVLQFLPVKKLP
jgi:hypothetical protein